MNGECTRDILTSSRAVCSATAAAPRWLLTIQRSGVRYPYFVCVGRHSKRESCKQKAVLIDVIEDQVQQSYDRDSFPPELRDFLGKAIRKHIENEQEKYETELDGLRREKEKLEHQRKKLLEAHYNDAIPLDLMKAEQQKITKQLAAIENQMNLHEHTLVVASEYLSEAMEPIENCGRTYRMASDHIKRMMNQAIFSKLWVESDGRITAEFKAPFTVIAEPIRTELASFNKEKIRSAKALTDFLSTISNRIQKFFGYG